MGWLARLLGAVPREERDGIGLDCSVSHWQLDGTRCAETFLTALRGWLPDGAMLYFEGGSPDDEIRAFMARHAVPERVHVAMGTIWPRPSVFHVPVSDAVLVELAGIMAHHAEPELAIHVLVYRDDTVLLQWYDAFSDPLLLSGSIAREQVEELARRIGGGFEKVVERAGEHRGER